jgi:hypothetical protein
MNLLRTVAVALGNWGSPQAVPALARALNDEEPLVRGHAAWALGRISVGPGASPGDMADVAAALLRRWAVENDTWVREGGLRGARVLTCEDEELYFDFIFGSTSTATTRYETHQSSSTRRSSIPTVSQAVARFRVSWRTLSGRSHATTRVPDILISPLDIRPPRPIDSLSTGTVDPESIVREHHP